MADNKKKAKKKNNKFLKIATIIVFVIAVLAVGANSFISNMYNTGEGIKEDIRTAEELQDKVINILVCGIDYEEGRTSANTDVMVYVTLDVEAGKISALQIPRDTYVGDDIKTGGSKKFNGVFSHGKNDNQIMNLIEAVNNKLGLAVDHYVTLDMEALIAMVDWIDWGFEMYIPYPVYNINDKGEKDYIIKEPGWHRVSGSQVEQIVRNRNYRGGDTARLEVQNYFYASLVKSFMENLNTSDFIKIMDRFTRYITTDLHWTKIASMAQFAFSVDYANMVIIKPAVHGYNVVYEGNTNATNILVAEKGEWAEILNTYFRPYQNEIPADKLKLPGKTPAGEITADWGVVPTSTRTIADILSGTGE